MPRNSHHKIDRSKPAGQSTPPMIAAAMVSDTEAELLIYGNIGDNWWSEGVIAKDVQQELAGIDADRILVRINSYGGSVSDGIAIYNLLRQHAAEIVVRIDSVAVSIASLIAMAGDRVEAPENIMFMVHAPWTVLDIYTGANSKAMREIAKYIEDNADLLDRYAEAMSSSYARKTGKDKSEILELLTDGEDHWYLASEAVEYGFIDAILEDEEEDDMPDGFAKSRFVVSAIQNAPGVIGMKVAAALGLPASPRKPAASVAATPQRQESNMPRDNKQATDPTAPEDKVTQEQVLAAEKQRKADIRAVFKPFMERDGMRDLQDACIDDHEITADLAREKILAKLGKGSEPLGADVTVTEDRLDKFRKGAEASIMARARMSKDDSRNEFRSYSLLDLARASLEMCGVSVAGRDKMDVVGMAFTHSTSDFGSLLANIASKAMLRGYDEAEETFQLWTVPGELPDFKLAGRPDLSQFPALDKVTEGGEYKMAQLTDGGEMIQLATYGKLFSITRQAIINDDLQAFTRIPMMMGRAAIRTVGDLVYAILTSNPNMADGQPLFHADHKNLLAAGGITTEAVDKMRTAMATQKDIGENATALNIALAYLLVPRKLEGIAKVVRDSEFDVGASAKNNTIPNSVRNTFEVVADARLDAVAGNASYNWFGAANPAVHDTIEVAYLDGNDAPVLEQQNGWNIDGVQFKVRMDAGVKALSHRTLAKNPWTGS